MMKVEPLGLPAALKAWRQKEPDPLLTMRCAAEADCGTQVGAVYRSVGGVVVESRVSVPAARAAEAAPPPDLADIVASMDITGMYEGFAAPSTQAEPGDEAEESVQAQIDLLHSDIYWQNPTPVCPRHGALRVDHDALAEAVRTGSDRYDATPA